MLQQVVFGYRRRPVHGGRCFFELFFEVKLRISYSTRNPVDGLTRDFQEIGLLYMNDLCTEQVDMQAQTLCSRKDSETFEVSQLVPLSY